MSCSARKSVFGSWNNSDISTCAIDQNAKTIILYAGRHFFFILHIPGTADFFKTAETAAKNVATADITLRNQSDRLFLYVPNNNVPVMSGCLSKWEYYYMFQNSGTK